MCDNKRESKDKVKHYHIYSNPLVYRFNAMPSKINESLGPRSNCPLWMSVVRHERNASIHERHEQTLVLCNSSILPFRVPRLEFLVQLVYFIMTNLLGLCLPGLGHLLLPTPLDRLWVALGIKNVVPPPERAGVVPNELLVVGIVVVGTSPERQEVV